MTAEDIKFLVTIAGFAVMVAGIVFAFGKRDAEFTALRERVKEDRDKNTDQHKEFYAAKGELNQIVALFPELDRRMSAMERVLEEIRDRLPRREDRRSLEP